jgi:hypothetical protein
LPTRTLIFATVHSWTTPEICLKIFDKGLLSMDESMGGLFLLVKGYFGIEKQGLTMRLG